MDKKNDIPSCERVRRPWDSDLRNYCQGILHNIGWNEDEQQTSYPDVHSIVFTSPQSEQGATTLAVTTAVAATEYEPARVLLLDCSSDFESRNYFDVIDEEFDNDIKLGRYVQRTDVDFLYLLSINNVAEFRNAQRMRLGIDQLKRCFDLIVVDMPSSFTRRWRDQFLTSFDSVLVIANQSCERELINETARKLHEIGVRNLGLVLNMADPPGTNKHRKRRQ